MVALREVPDYVDGYPLEWGSYSWRWVNELEMDLRHMDDENVNSFAFVKPRDEPVK
jgi:hypothetical protein